MLLLKKKNGFTYVVEPSLMFLISNKISFRIEGLVEVGYEVGGVFETY
jgi:hypothetical protein